MPATRFFFDVSPGGSPWGGPGLQRHHHTKKLPGTVPNFSGGIKILFRRSYDFTAPRTRPFGPRLHPTVIWQGVRLVNAHDDQLGRRFDPSLDQVCKNVIDYDPDIVFWGQKEKQGGEFAIQIGFVAFGWLFGLRGVPP